MKRLVFSFTVLLVAVFGLCSCAAQSGTASSEAASSVESVSTAEPSFESVSAAASEPSTEPASSTAATSVESAPAATPTKPASSIGNASSSDAPKPSAQSATSAASSSTEPAAIAPDSILLFDSNAGSAKLVADMQAGITPSECSVLYDQEGMLPPVTVTDAKTIGDIYNLLAQVTITGDTQYSETDSYHNVSFVLQDGTTVGFSFEGDKILHREKANYAVEGIGPLWACIRTLQADITGGKSVYAINVQDDADVVLECPTSAEEGSWVKLVCSTESGDSFQVFANDEEITYSNDIYIYTPGTEEKTPAQKKSYQFYMPSSDVTIKTTVAP